MNPKHRKVLLEELAALEKMIADYPSVKSIFPDIVAKVQALHKDVLYDKVEDKTGGLNLHAAKLGEIKQFVSDAIEFREGFIKALNKVKQGDDLWITLEVLVKEDLGSHLTTDFPLFKPSLAAVIDALSSISGEGVFKHELCQQLQDVLSQQYTLLDGTAIIECTSLRAIKDLNIPILDDFIAKIKTYKYLDDNAPKFDTFCQSLEKIFADNAVLTQEIFEKEVNTWLTTISNALKALGSNKLAGAGIHIKLVSALLKQQFAALPEAALKQVHAVMDGLILGIKESPTLTIKDFAELLEIGVKNFSIPKPSTADRAALGAVPNIKEQLSKINIADAVLGAVNINSPIFVVNQPAFRQNLVQKLSDWKDGLVNSLAVGADLILKLDGCTVNGAAFKSGILACAKIDAVHKALSGLAFDELKLKGHKDLKIFDEKWGNPWKAALKAIDIEKQIVAVYEGDSTMLVNLYTDLYAYLPSEDHVIATLNLSIGGKINLALEAVKKLEKRVDKISEEVKIIQSVNDLQTLALGYNSMITEIDIVYKGIIEAHKGYVHRIHLYCLEYGNAYEKVDDAVVSFNKAAEELKEFRESLFDAFTSIVSTALIATGIGGVGTLIAKMTQFVIKEAAEAFVEEGIKLAVDASGAKDAVVGDYPELKNSSTTPFMEYLSKQLDGEKEVVAALATIVQMSSQVQQCNSIIQYILEKKVNADIQLLAKTYNDMTKQLATWLKAQKAAINSYVMQTSKLAPIPNVTRNIMEHNMYIGIVGAQLNTKVDQSQWQIVCDAKAFRERLLVCNLIGKNDFVDNWGYDRGTDKELERLYAKKEIPLF